MSETDVVHAPRASSADPDADATVREFIDYTEYLPSDINRYLWRLRDLRTRHDESRAHLANHLKLFTGVASPPSARAPAKVIASSDTASSSQQLNGVNGLQRVVDSVSDKELELRLLISQCLNDTSYSVKESAVEAKRLEEYVERHHSRIAAIHGKLDTITIPSRDPTPEERRPPKSKPEDPPIRRITLRFGGARSASPQPPASAVSRNRGRLTNGRTPARRAPKTPISAPIAEDDEAGWEDVLDTPSATGMKPLKKKKGFAIKKGPKPPPADPLLSGGAPARFPDGSLIPNDQLPWNQLTNEELARLRKRMKKNAAWTPSVTMIVRELELLGRGPNNRGSFREQWEGKDEIFIGPEEGGIGDPQKILPDETTGSRENKGMKLNRAKKRKREEEKKERALEAERLGLDPVEEEKKHLAEEERQRKEQQLKRRKKKEEEQEEEEETTKADEEDAEREADEKAAQEEVESERVLAEAAAAAQANEQAETRAKEAEAQAKSEAEAEEAAKVSHKKAEQERQEKSAKEKAATEDGKISAEASAADTAAKKSNPSESDDELSDVPDLEEPPVINTEAPPKPRNRASKRTSARPASRPPRGISATPRPKRGAAISNVPAPSPPPTVGMTTRKRSQSVTPARSAASTKASAGKKPSAAKRPAAGARRRKRGGGGGETVDTNEEADEDLNKYCLCNEISRGTMVACENDECPKVWFHIGCVNLSKEEAEKEDLKWYCPICEDNTHGRRGTKRRRKN